MKYEGLKYVIFKNTVDSKTKINYRKSTRMPKIVKLPDDVLREKMDV